MQALLCTHCNPAWHRGCQLPLTTHAQVIQLSLLQRGFEPHLCYLLLILHWKTTDQHTRKKISITPPKVKGASRYTQKKARRIQLPKADTICLWFILCLKLPTSRSNFWKGSSEYISRVHLILSAEGMSCYLPCALIRLFSQWSGACPSVGIGSVYNDRRELLIVKCIGSFSPAPDSCFDPEIGKPRHKIDWGGGGPPKMLSCFRVKYPRESG